MSERDPSELTAIIETAQPSDLNARSSREINPTEKEAQAARAGKMRENPAMRTLLEFVRQDPDLYQQLRHFQTRRNDFIQAASNPGELHRGFTATFAALELNPRSKALLNEAIERTVEAETAWHKEQILGAETPSYYPEIVVGAGAHSAMYNAERMALDPDHPALTIDANQRIGGQFAQPINSAFRLNSRTRPDNPNLPNIPGTEGALNTIERGVLQQADLTGEIYGTQDTLADAIRVNHLLHSEIMASSRLYKLRRNTSSETEGKYLAFLQDVPTGQDLVVSTDRIVNAGGLGREITGLDESNQITKRITTEELARYERAGDSALMTSAQLMQRIGNPAIEFPLQGYKKVAVVGPGDGGRIAVEALTGKMQAGKSVTNLDRVKAITWLGQKSESCDEFKAANRLRYANEVALEFPRKDQPEYPSRIVPIDARAYRVEREGEEIRLFWKDDDGQEVSDVFDHVILATGYEDTSDEIFATLNDEDITSADEIRQRVDQIIDTQGAVIKLKRETSTTEIEILTPNSSQAPDAQIVLAVTEISNGEKIKTRTGIDNKQSFRGFLEFSASDATVTLPGQLEREPVYTNNQSESEPAKNVESQLVSLKVYDTQQDINENATEIVNGSGAILSLENGQSIEIIDDSDLPKTRLAYRVKNTNGEVVEARNESNKNAFIRTFIRSGRVQQAEIPQFDNRQVESQEQNEVITLSQSEIPRRVLDIIKTPGAIVNYDYDPKNSQAATRLIVNRYTRGENTSEDIVDFTLELVDGTTINRASDASEFEYYYLDPEDTLLGVKNVLLPSSPKEEVEPTQLSYETLSAQEAITRAREVASTVGAVITYNDKETYARQVIIDNFEGQINEPNNRVGLTIKTVGGSTEQRIFAIDEFAATFLRDRDLELIDNVTLPSSKSVEAIQPDQNRTLSSAEALNRAREVITTEGAIISYTNKVFDNRQIDNVIILKYIENGGAFGDEGSVRIALNRIDGTTQEEQFDESEFKFYFLNPAVGEDIESVTLPSSGNKSSQNSERQRAQNSVEELSSAVEIANRSEEIAQTIGAEITYPNSDFLESVLVTNVDTDSDGDIIIESITRYKDGDEVTGQQELDFFTTLNLSSPSECIVRLPAKSTNPKSAESQFAASNRIFETKEAVVRAADLIASTVGAEIIYTYANGDKRKLLIDQIDYDDNGRPLNVRISQYYNGQRETLGNTVFGIDSFKKIFLSTTITAEISAVLPTKSEQPNAEQLKTSPIASKYENEDIYNIGPASQLPLTEAEVAQSDALQKINENTAALFRYGQYTAELANLLAQQDAQNEANRLNRSEMRPPVPEPKQLKPLPKEAQLGQTERYIIDANELVSMPTNQNSGDLLKYVSALQLREYIFPESLPDITIALKQVKQSNENTVFDVSFTPNILVSQEYKEALANLLEDTSIKNIISRASQTMPNRTVVITLPLSQGRVDIHGVSLRVN